MPGRSLFLSRAALLAALSASVATTAHAQLGKLKKIGVDAAKDAAMGKKPEPPKDPTAPRIDYNITAERLTAIVTALKPSLAAAQRQMAVAEKERAARTVKVDYDAKFKASSDCLTKSMKGLPDLGATESPKYEALQKKAEAASKRVSSASAAKKNREYLAASDTAMVASMRMNAMMYKNSCPEMPFKPDALIEAEAASMDRAAAEANSNSQSSSELDVPPEARAGMTTGQWGKIRERVACWLLIQSGDLPATAEKFTEAEQSLLSSRAAEIKEFGPVFKSGTMQWVNWGDIKSW